MFAFLPRPFAILLLLLAGTMLASCGSDDEKTRQGKAFADFLETHIVDAPTVSVPMLSDSDAQAIGPYAADYRILIDFTESMDREMADFKKYASVSRNVKTLQDLREKWREVEYLKGVAAEKTGPRLTDQLQKATAAKAALSQPDFVKEVYDKAFEKTVSVPAKSVQDLAPTLTSAMGTMVEMGRFLDSNRDNVKVSGMMVESSNLALQEQFLTLMRTYDTSHAKLTKDSKVLSGLIDGD